MNVALRRSLSQLHYYTEGNVPEALIGVPAGWTPDQIGQFQLYWDSLMEGNTAGRRHARFIPGDMKYQPTREPALKDQYDEWLARVVCYAFSVPPTPFVAHVNRATAESAHDAALEEGLQPLQGWVKRLIDQILAREFAAPDLEFAWIDDRVTDAEQAARTDDLYVRNGVKSVDEVRASLGLDPIGQGNAVYGGQATPIGGGASSFPSRGAAAPSTDHGLGKYRPDQPRVPAGQHGGGQWTTEGGEGAGAGHIAVASDFERHLASGTIPENAPEPGDHVIIDPSSKRLLERAVPFDKLEKDSQTDIMRSREIRPDGTIKVQIPPDYVPEPSRGEGGVQYRPPGATGDESSIRIMMLPDKAGRYPEGRVIINNREGKPISPYTGKPDQRHEDSHSHYRGRLPADRHDEDDESGGDESADREEGKERLRVQSPKENEEGERFFIPILPGLRVPGPRGRSVGPLRPIPVPGR